MHVRSFYNATSLINNPYPKQSNCRSYTATRTTDSVWNRVNKKFMQAHYITLATGTSYPFHPTSANPLHLPQRIASELPHRHPPQLLRHNGPLPAVSNPRLHRRTHPHPPNRPGRGATLRPTRIRRPQGARGEAEQRRPAMVCMHPIQPYTPQPTNQCTTRLTMDGRTTGS